MESTLTSHYLREITMRYAMIMAGGSGKRLWPASRESKPKQLIKLVDGKNLLEVATSRLEGLFGPEQVLIVTNAAYVDSVRDCLTGVPAENVIGEPQGRDTANAIALGAELIAARDPDATMAVFTADHIIRPKEQFDECIERACRAAEDDRGALVTLGIRPTWPHTGLGYIHRGEKINDAVGKVLAFKEKPDHRTARWYVESGEYFWNSGMFIWNVETIRKALAEFLPATAKRLAPIGELAAAGKDYAAALAEAYPDLEKISIDYAVMEKAPHVQMVELTCEWLDVGSWPAMENILRLDADGNAVAASRAAVLDSDRNIIFCEDDHLLAVLGMDDCIIVHTADATLVCKKDDSQRLKELVDWIGQHFGSQYV